MVLFDARTEVWMNKHSIHTFLMQYGGVEIQMAPLQELDHPALSIQIATH